MRAGDDQARSRLVTRYLAILRSWAHGRLPPRARSLADTEDLVQVTLMRALDGVKSFEPRRGALPDGHPDNRPSLLAEAIGAEAADAQEAARMLVARAMVHLPERMLVSTQ